MRASKRNLVNKIVVVDCIAVKPLDQHKGFTLAGDENHESN